jgi:hypothetical protein
MKNILNNSGKEILEMMVSQLGKEITIERLARDYRNSVYNGYKTKDRAMLEHLGCEIVGGFNKVNWYVRTDEGKKIKLK